MAIQAELKVIRPSARIADKNGEKWRGISGDQLSSDQVKLQSGRQTLDTFCHSLERRIRQSLEWARRKKSEQKDAGLAAYSSDH
jgi:hypothetical protein